MFTEQIPLAELRFQSFLFRASLSELRVQSSALRASFQSFVLRALLLETRFRSFVFRALFSEQCFQSCLQSSRLYKKAVNVTWAAEAGGNWKSGQGNQLDTPRGII